MSGLRCFSLVTKINRNLQGISKITYIFFLLTFSAAVGQFNNEAPITRQVQLGRPFNFSCPPHGPSYGVSFTWTSKKELNIPCNSHPFARSERVAIDPSNGNLHIMYVTPQDITHIRDLGGIQCKISGANTFYSSGPLTLTTQQGAFLLLLLLLLGSVK